VNVSELVAQSVLLTRSDAIIAADRDGIICFWNPGAERMFGHVSGEAIGRSLDLIIPERLRQRHWDGFRQTMETGRSRYGEVTCSRFQPFARMARQSPSSSQLCC